MAPRIALTAKLAWPLGLAERARVRALQGAVAISPQKEDKGLRGQLGEREDDGKHEQGEDT